jgi:hypothetical protein
MRQRWHDGGMNPTDPAADPFDIHHLTPEMVERLPKDPAVLQRLVRDLIVLIHQERQETQELKRLADYLEHLLEPPPGPSAPSKKKRRRH